MKKLTFLIILILGISGLSRAQYSMDFGLSLGGSTYMGEIDEPGDNDDYPLPINILPRGSRYNIGLFYRYNFTKNIAARFEANYVRVAGDDDLSDDPIRLGRNLSFRTDIFEFTLQGEYAWWVRNEIGNSSNIDFRADVHAGIGYMLYYPEAQIRNKWYNLRTLATEGIENEYGTGSLILPVGLGFSWTFNKNVRFGMDFNYRFTFTDYIDDISTDYAFVSELPYLESIAFANRSAEVYESGNQELPDPSLYEPGAARGNSDDNDAYFVVQFKISYVIPMETSSFSKPRHKRYIKGRR